MKQITMTYFVFKLQALVLTVAFIAAQDVRICTDSTEATKKVCSDMETDLAGKPYKLKCVPTRDRIDCMRKIANGTIDVVNLPINEAYVASLNYGLITLAKEGWEGQEPGVRYHGVAVVRKSSNINSLADLQSKKSCHTAYGRTTGWQIPVSVLQASVSLGDKCGELEYISNFFSKSCLPGYWSPDEKLDKLMKTKFKNLCELCKSQCQDEKEEYLGYDGALRCLVETNADVAFSKLDVSKDFFTEKQKNDYLYLCSNGSTSPLDRPCYLATRPTNLFMIKDGSDKEAIFTALKQAVSDSAVNNSRPYWVTELLVTSDLATTIHPEGNTTETIMENRNFKVVIDKPLQEPCKEDYLRFCVTSDLGKQKCEDFKAAAFAQRLRPQIDCFVTESREKCLNAISEGKADIVSADTGDVLAGAKLYNLLPLMAEQYGNLNLSYYPVAVIHASSNITEFEDLRGLKSCHTGEGRTAGWNVPVGQLLKKGLIKSAGCDSESEVSKFFSSSCVPGATKQHKNLCALCIGDENGKDVCASKDSERYSGYSGAFRCLAEKGDVAFVKHTTVAENTDGKNKAEWASNLKSENYKLLCANDKITSVDDFENCHLAKIPSHQVIISDKNSEDKKLDIAFMLAKASFSFGPNADSFKLFGNYYNGKDLLFKDSATNLVSYVNGTSVSSTAKETLGETLYEDLLSVYCSP